MPRAFALLLLLACAVAQARVATLAIESVALPLGTLEQVSVRLDDAGELALVAKSLQSQALGYRFRDLRWTCALQRDASGALHCRGPLRARGGGKAVLVAEWTAGVLALRIEGNGGQLGLAFGEPLQLRGVDVPAAWLQPLLAARWPAARLTDGRIDATLQFGRSAAQGTSMRGPLAFDALGLDTRDGRIAAAALDASGTLAMAFDPNATAVDLDLTLAGGELLAGAFYARLPASPIALQLGLRGDARGWAMPRLAWSDPGVLAVQGSGAFAPDATLAALEATLDAPDLALAAPRYFDSLLGTVGLKGLALRGAAKATMTHAAGAWQSASVQLADVDATDAAARFAFAGLAGEVAWSAGAPRDGTLRWSTARVHGVGFGPATLPLRSENGGIALQQPVTLDLLGGQLAIPRFAWNAGALDLALSLRALDLRQLSQALHWPAFTGTLSGELPAVRYADEVLSFDGGLGVDVFDGRVEVAELTLERPFGVAPTLVARVALDNLDLQPLTAVFGFGEITGRLDGRIEGLRVVDWQPVAFDADLHTDSTAKDARRISQRAVQDLSTVGGAGVVAGLQAQALRLFNTFPYARIGLRCRLANNVCDMAGLDSSKGGYTIVEGSGLPRITVVGHQQRVDWPVLVSRLKAATDGQAPIVN